MDETKPKEKDKSFHINPVVGTVLVAVIGLIGTGIGASVGGYFDIQLEKEKLRTSLILKAVETDNPESALNYLKLLRDTGLVTDIDVTITEWSKDSTLVPLRPNANQAALDGMANTNRATRINATEQLIKEKASDPEVIRAVLISLSNPNTTDGLWNNIVFLNATKSVAYDADLVDFALREIASFEGEVSQGNIRLGPATKRRLTVYKNYLRDIRGQF